MRPQKQQSTVPTTIAIIMLLVVAGVSFLAGSRYEEYALFDSSEVATDDVATSEELPEDLNYESVEEVYDVLRKRFDGQLTEAELMDGLKSGLAEASGDPYTVYLNPEDAEQFDNDLNGTFSGIGAEIGLENEVIIVVAPLEGFPAEQAGLRAQDAIIAIDGEETFGMSIEDAVLKIRGEKGTDVTLTILRDGQQQDITITRDDIKIPSVEYEVLDGNVGYIRLSRFAEDTNQLMRDAAQDLKDQGVNGVILDIRNNGGGYLNAAVDVVGIWLNNSLVVEQRENGGTIVTQSLSTSNNAILEGMPTVILINEGSASASEIVAGAMQDYDAATLIGQTTFGKGSVQSLEPAGGGSVLKVTIARWFTPNGQNIDEEGVSPDQEVERTNEDIDDERDPQLDAAKEFLQ